MTKNKIKEKLLAWSTSWKQGKLRCILEWFFGILGAIGILSLVALSEWQYRVLAYLSSLVLIASIYFILSAIIDSIADAIIDKVRIVEHISYKENPTPCQEDVVKIYEEKIRIILKNRLENNCNYNLEINAVKTWLCCECYCGEIGADTYSLLANRIEEIADEIMRKE